MYAILDCHGLLCPSANDIFILLLLLDKLNYYLKTVTNLLLVVDNDVHDIQNCKGVRLQQHKILEST